MLNEEPTTYIRHLCDMKQCANGIQLVITRPNDGFLHLVGLLVFTCYHLCKVLNDIRERWLSQYILPQIRGHGVALDDRIASTAINAAVKRQEPGVLTSQCRTHPHLAVIHGKVYGTAFLLQQQFLRVTVSAVLHDGILVGLPCIVVLQLEGGERQTVDEYHNVYFVGIHL